MRIAVLSALVVFGCEQRRSEVTTTAAPMSTSGSATHEAPKAATAAPSATALQTPTVRAKMAEHFTSSVALRDALIKGDLDAFRVAAATLSDKELSANLSATWKPHLERMRSAAKRARDAKTVTTGAQALADLGRACAGCHTSLGGPKLSVGEPPAPASGAKPHMARHHWAAARMWEGLMGPSEAAWTKGTEVFADAPLEREAIAGPTSVPPEVSELANRSHAVGRRAQNAKGATARAKAVADVYGTCVGCHTKLNVNL